MFIKFFGTISTLFFFCTAATADINWLNVSSITGIYVGKKQTAINTTTVKHLQAAIKKLYDIKLPILVSIDEGQKVIVIGREAAIKAHRLNDRDFQTIKDGFIIRSDQDGIVVAGNDPWATQSGVYHFLEKIGMRFYDPSFNNAQLPKKNLNKIPTFSNTVIPDFSFRSGRKLLWGQMYNQLGNPKKGQNPELFDNKITGSDLWVDHTAGYLVPKLMFYDSHPEYYAQVKGKRIEPDRFTDHRTPLCLSNKDVKRISTERALEWVRREPDKKFFMITYGDTSVWCQCSKCLKLDIHKGIYSDRLLSWVNPIARAIKEEAPDKIIMTFAYSETNIPPAIEKPEENVWIVGSTGLGNFPFWDHLYTNGKIPLHHLNKLDGWLKVAPHQYAVCEYLSNQYEPALIDNMVSRLRFYKERGVRGIVFTYGAPKNFKGIWAYVYSHLMWDVSQDEMQLANGYVDFHFKKAADYIKKILSLTHTRYASTLYQDVSIRNNYPVEFYSNNYTSEMADAFAKAEEAVKDDENLFNEIRIEEQFFIYDWIRHPSSNFLDEEAKTLLLEQMKRLATLTPMNKKDRNKLGRELHRIALEVEHKHKGTKDVVEKWILTEKLHTTVFEKISNGIVLQPESFQFAGFGPARYGHNCPPKNAVGVYVKGNSKRRSHRMIAEFDWDTTLVNNGNNIILTLLGQSASTGILSPKLRIQINGVEVYSGSADFVSNNWSAQEYEIPARLLKGSNNIIEIENISNPLSIIRWNQRWCLIANAEILTIKNGSTKALPK